MENGENETDYRRFIETFCNGIEGLRSEDIDVPFRLSTYYLAPSELEGECLEWIRRYLSMHNCPTSLLPQLTRAVFTTFNNTVRLSEYFVEKTAKDGTKSADSSDGESTDDRIEGNEAPHLDATKLLNRVVSQVHETLRLWKLSPPSFTMSSCGLLVSSHAIKNSRRKMEDRHVVITDLNMLYDLKDSPPQSYFAIFDGHGGLDAATYASTHLHGYMLADKLFTIDPAAAMKQAYKTTDIRFLERANRENLRSGTTGISVLIRSSEVHLGWLGDSQAIIVRGGRPVKIMDPHKPEREDEKKRIEDLGGCVVFIGTWRVNGNIAVSRAIGDATHKPFISSDADVTSIQLSCEDEYLVIACDGLWDVLDPSQVAHLVYDHVQASSHGVTGVANTLVNAARDNGSSDNISVIVVFFKTSLSDPDSAGANSLPSLNELAGTLPSSFAPTPPADSTRSAAGGKENVNLSAQKGGQVGERANSGRTPPPRSHCALSQLSGQRTFTRGQPAQAAHCCNISPEVCRRKVKLKPSLLK